MAVLAFQPSARAFVTLAMYKAFDDPNNQDTTKDDIRQFLINATCAGVEQFLNRPVVQQIFTNVLLDGSDANPGMGPLLSGGKHQVFLKAPVIIVGSPAPAFTLAESTDGNQTYTALTMGMDYLLYDDEGAVERANLGRPRRWAAGKQNLQLTYTAGLCTQVLSGGALIDIKGSVTRNQTHDISDVQLAVMQWIKFHEKTGPLDYGSLMQAGTMFQPSAMPLFVKDALSRRRTRNV